MTVVLYQFSSDWDLPNPSPFCFKAETWLRLASIEYTVKAWSPGLSSTKKAPVVRVGDDVVADSTRIIEFLTKKFDIGIDAHLDERQRAMSLVIRRTLEEHAYWAILHERWIQSKGFRQYAPVIGFSIPAVVRPLVLSLLRRGVVKSAHGQGLSRHSFTEIQARGQQDFEAVAQLFEGDFVFGASPTTVDATVFAFVECAAHPMFDNLIGQHLRASTFWSAYRRRMRERAWDDWADRFPPLPS